MISFCKGESMKKMNAIFSLQIKRLAKETKICQCDTVVSFIWRKHSQFGAKVKTAIRTHTSKCNPIPLAFIQCEFNFCFVFLEFVNVFLQSENWSKVSAYKQNKMYNLLDESIISPISICARMCETIPFGRVHMHWLVPPLAYKIRPPPPSPPPSALETDTQYTNAVYPKVILERFRLQTQKHASGTRCTFGRQCVAQHSTTCLFKLRKMLQR